MNSGTRSGIRLLIAFMSFAFVFSVFFVSTPSTVVASSGNWTFIVRGSDVTFNADLWPPPSWYNYPAGSTPPTMAACAAGSGRVVAFGGSFAIRNSYVTLDVEQLIDATFRWLAKREDNVRSTIKVLWYEGYDVFYQNYKTNCGTLKNWLVSKGYTDSNIVADNTEPIADIPGLSSYDILFIPQLEPEASEAQEGIGGDPTLIPSSDYEAIRHFVEDLGKGLLILESADFSSSGPYGHSYYHVQNAIINNIENGMYFQSDTIKKDTSQYGGLDVPFVVGTAHWIGQSYLIDHGSTSCVLDSVCSMTVVPEQGPSVSIQLVQSFKYGAPGATLSYAVKVLNNGTIVDNYNLAASAGWVGVTLSTNKLINVEPLTTRTVSLSITIPSGASRGSSTNITVTATSENKPSLSKSAKGSAHAAPFSVDPVLGVWTSVYTSPRLMNYGVGVWGAGENIYILNNYSSSVGSCSDFTTYGRGDYFMRYNTVTGYWDDLTFPPFTLKNAAHNMCWDHGNYLYAVPGGSYADAASKVVHAFCRYNIANGSWETLPNTPMWQGPGDSLVWVKLGANEYIYAWLGTTSYSVILSKGNDPYAELWRFNISTNSWDSQFLRHVKGYLDYPSSGANQAQKDNGYGADDGCNLVWTGGDNIYYTPGAYTESLINKNEERRFLRYTISTNTLAEMSSPPDTGNGGFDDGGSMVYPGSGDYIYVIKGGDDTGSGGGSPGVAFWRYKISTNTWETLQNLPAGVGANNGCRIGYAGGGKIYYWVGPSSTASDKNLYVYGIESAGVDVSAPQNENSAASGMTVTFTVTVRTTGTVSDTYDLTVSGNASWSPILSQSSVGPLPPSVSSSVTLSVTIPSGTANGASQTITVTATSRANAAVTDSVSCIARCVTPPGVEVSISHTSKSGLSGSTLTYTVTVTNTGTASDTYTLTKSDSAVPNWSPSLSKDTVGPLAPGASDTAQLSVTIPSTAADGDSTTITVTATSRADAAVTDSVSCIARCVNPPGIEVSISPLSESGLSGSTLTYTVTVTNTGTASDTYTLTKNDSAAPSWSPSLSKDTVGPLAPGASGTAQLSVTIPAGTAEGVSHTITVTATSQASTTVKANASCVALAIEAIHPRVVVTISPSSRENENGGTLRYTVTVTNAGNVADDYTLSATDTLGWSLTLPSSIADVARNEDRTVTLTVGISDNAADGDSSTITVTATSSENTEVENSATCTARCATGETRVTSLTIFPSRFPLFPGYSGQVQSLTATLRVGNNPLPNKRITWAATAGSVSQSNGTTDALGQVSVYYTTPAVTVETPQVTITASFAGDAQYQASSGTSLGIPAIPISVNIPASTGGTVVITVIEINVTVNILVVPSNALSADTTITVVQAPRESISNYKMVSHVFNVGPSGTTFATSSTLTLPYDESELPVGVSEGDLAIYRRTSGGGWERVGGNVNTTANTVSAQIDHLSEYAVMSGLGGGGLPLLPIGVIVAVILIIAVIAVFIRRR